LESEKTFNEINTIFMIKLLVDLAPFMKGEVLSVGKTYDTYLVDKGLAVWVKVDKEKFKTK
jgi:hypothetical protein